MITLLTGNIALTTFPTTMVIQNCSFTKNAPFSKALIVVNQNCLTFIYNSYFLENYSIARGSVLMADYQNTVNYFENCTFINNSASVGGVFYTQFGSTIKCVNCTLTNNFGIKAGAIYTSNDGYVVFQNSKILQNKSLYSSIIIMLTSPTSYSEFTNSYIFNNTLLSMTQFVNSTTNTIQMMVPELGYLKPDFLAYLFTQQ